MANTLRNLRLRAYDAQCGRCFYCHFPMWIANAAQFARSWGMSLAEARRFQCTAEHLVPVAEGGLAIPTNIVAACRFCNQTRHRARKIRSADQYADHVRRRVAAHRWHRRSRGASVTCETG